MSHDNPQAGQNRPLPKKEADLFKSVLKYYEGKLYKKGIKSADAILRKFPNHGETLAMKGLTLNCVGKREEAHGLVKRGLTNDMRSHVCWHVYGLLHRSDRNYNEAIKAYKQALRIDPENLQILRDLSLLQIQMRDLSGFVVTRNTILTLKPNNKIHWIAFALAKHLAGDREGAVAVIDCYLGTLDEHSSELQKGFESSELALYRNMILNEIPNNEKAALEHLEQCKSLVVDQTAWLFAKARNQLMLGLYDDARTTFVRSLRRGSTEDYKVHSGYMCALLKLDKSVCEFALKLKGTDVVSTTVQLTDDQKQVVLKAYTEELAPIIPYSHALRRIPLTLLQGDELRKAIDAYCRRDIAKGVPYLGKDLSALFIVEVVPEANGSTEPAASTPTTSKCQSGYIRLSDPMDVRNHPLMAVLVELVDGYISSLRSTGRFPGDSEENNKEEPPSSLLWSMYLRTHLHEMCGEYSEGLALIETCIEHTPTAVDMYEKKARLLKLCGDIGSAADCLDTARELDLQDRYINNKTTKYLLRAQREETALERISLFTKHEGNPEQNLFDMQCAWYELELADCLARKGDWGRSLKKYMAVEKHFEDFHEDQFDFHSYCIRKVTLRAYVDVLRFEDDLWGHKFYCRAAEGILRCYIHLFDNPDDARTDSDEPDYSGMTPAERKKAKALQRKKMKKKAAAEQRKLQAAQQAQQQNNQNGGQRKKKGGGAHGGGGAAARAEVVDDDPRGEKLLKRDHLDEAKKYVGQLVQVAPDRLTTWVLRYDVAIRRKKKLMALQALFKARTIDPNSSEVFTRVVDFARKWSENSEEEQNAAVQEVVSAEMTALLEGKTVKEFVTSMAERVKVETMTGLPMRVAVAEALVATEAWSKMEASSLIVKGGLEGRMVSVANCRLALRLLTSFGEDAQSAQEEWIAKVMQRFPLVKDFK